MVFPGGTSGEESTSQCRRWKRMWVRSLGWEDSLEVGIATHSSILAWRIPQTEEPGGLQSHGVAKSQTQQKQLSMPTQWLYISSVQSLSRVPLFATPWIAAHQASLSITNSRSSLRLTSIESVMPSNHLIICHPLFLPSSVFPSIRVFSNESVLCIRWPKY